jgi:hypothetical protein
MAGLKVKFIVCDTPAFYPDGPVFDSLIPQINPLVLIDVFLSRFKSVL